MRDKLNMVYLRTWNNKYTIYVSQISGSFIAFLGSEQVSAADRLYTLTQRLNRRNDA